MIWFKGWYKKGYWSHFVICCLDCTKYSLCSDCLSLHPLLLLSINLYYLLSKTIIIRLNYKNKKEIQVVLIKSLLPQITTPLSHVHSNIHSPPLSSTTGLFVVFQFLTFGLSLQSCPSPTLFYTSYVLTIWLSFLYCA